MKEVSNDARIPISNTPDCCGQQRRTAEKTECEVDWLKVEQLAKDQMGIALVGYALMRSPEIGCPEDIRKRMLLSMRQTVVVNFTKKAAIVELLDGWKRLGSLRYIVGRSRRVF